MKKFLLLICLLGIVSCEKEEKTLPFSTGITGIVKYGEGDCMPIFDRDEADYDNYTGKLYFIIKSELEALGEGNFDELLDKSISTNVKNGILELELPPETYLVMPEDVYQYSEENTVTIREGIVLKKNFYFWKCLSY